MAIPNITPTAIYGVTSPSRIYYEKGKKYQLTRDSLIKTDVIGYSIVTDYATLYQDGWLLVRKGFAWDGASGPAIDTKNNMRASCAHDVLYKFMRRELLPRTEQKNADLSLRNIMKRDKASASRAWAWFIGLTWFGRDATDPDNKNKEYSAP